MMVQKDARMQIIIAVFFKNIHSISSWVIRDKDKAISIRTPNTMIANNGTSLVQAAAAGLGITMGIHQKK